jgi:hypothetical protein
MQLFECAPEIHNFVFIKKSEKYKMPKKVNEQNSILSKIKK